MSITSMAMAAKKRTALPHRSSPRKRGPRAACTKELDSRLRGNEREELASPALYRLMAWLSPAYPVGAFSYSSGIEWAVEAGDIKDAETLRDWLATMLTDGAGFCDAVLFADGASRRRPRTTTRRCATWPNSPPRWRRARSAIWKPPRRATPSSRRRRRPGRRRRSTGSKRFGTAPSPIRWRWRSPRPATASRSKPTLSAFLQAVAANWVSAGVRLVPLGQTDGQRVLAALEERGGRHRATRALRHARRSRFGGLPRRPRLRPPRDPVHAAVPVITEAAFHAGLDPAIPMGDAMHRFFR